MSAAVGETMALLALVAVLAWAVIRPRGWPEAVVAVPAAIASVILVRAGTLPAASTGSQLTTRTTTVPAKAPVKARKGKAADDDDDLGDVADILRRHGIN